MTVCGRVRFRGRYLWRAAIREDCSLIGSAYFKIFPLLTLSVYAGCYLMAHRAVVELSGVVSYCPGPRDLGRVHFRHRLDADGFSTTGPDLKSVLSCDGGHIVC